MAVDSLGVASVSVHCELLLPSIYLGHMARRCRSTVQDFGNICALQGTVPVLYIVQRESVPYGFLSFGQF